jgi:hypothetical protein
MVLQGSIWSVMRRVQPKFMTDPGISTAKDILAMQQAELQSDVPHLPVTETPVICEARQIASFLTR